MTDLVRDPVCLPHDSRPVHNQRCRDSALVHPVFIEPERSIACLSPRKAIALEGSRSSRWRISLPPIDGFGTATVIGKKQHQGIVFDPHRPDRPEDATNGSVHTLHLCCVHSHRQILCSFVRCSFPCAGIFIARGRAPAFVYNAEFDHARMTGSSHCIPTQAVCIPVFGDILGKSVKWKMRSRESNIEEKRFKGLEPQLGEFGELGFMSDWAGKLAGAAVRIAGLLHLAQYAADGALQSAEIKPKTMDAAIRVGEYFIPHARAAYAEMGADGVIQDTRYILRWIKEKLHKSFTKRALFQETKGRFKRVEALGQPLGILMEHGFIGERPTAPRPGPGRKPSPIFDVNPCVFQGPNGQKAEGKGMSVAERSTVQFPTRFPSAYASDQTGAAAHSKAEQDTQNSQNPQNSATTANSEDSGNSERHIPPPVPQPNSRLLPGLKPSPGRIEYPD